MNKDEIFEKHSKSKGIDMTMHVKCPNHRIDQGCVLCSGTGYIFIGSISKYKDEKLKNRVMDVEGFQKAVEEVMGENITKIIKTIKPFVEIYKIEALKEHPKDYSVNKASDKNLIINADIKMGDLVKLFSLDIELQKQVKK